MNAAELIRIRLGSQQLIDTAFSDPVKLVQHLGAVQSQDYAASKWALGLRLKKASDQLIEKAIDDGKIIRTHILRPTWHFVAASDIRWMLQLSGPRVNTFNAPMYRKQELDAAIFKRSHRILEKALQGNKHLTRTEIASEFEKAKIDTSGLRLILLLMQAELEGLICNGARRGKQFTYTLLDERVPKTSSIKGEEALSQLALTYFKSRGPATLADFTWWSGLTVKDAKKGLESVKGKLIAESIENTEYWMYRDKLPPMPSSTFALLLPAFDEYTVAYKNRAIIMDPALPPQTPLNALNPQIAINGLLSGTWRRTLKKEGAEVELKPLKKLSRDSKSAVDKEIGRYNKFLSHQK